MFNLFKNKKQITNTGEKEKRKCKNCNSQISVHSPEYGLCMDCFLEKRVYSGKASENVFWFLKDEEIYFYGNGNVEYIKNSIDDARNMIYDPHNLGFAYDFSTFWELITDKRELKMVFCDGINQITIGSRLSSFIKELIISPSVTHINDDFISSYNKENITIKGVQGTYAEEYSIKNNVTFISIKLNEIFQYNL